MQQSSIKLKATLLILFSAFLSANVNSATITTTFAYDNGFAGNTFDVTNVSGASITLDGFDINLGLFGTLGGGVGTGPHIITIHYKLGTSVGFEGTPGAWTLMGTDSAVVSAGSGNPTPVNIGGLTIGPGETFGIYVDFTNYDTLMLLYTNGSQNFNDGVLQVASNSGQANPAFSGLIGGRVWNGNIHYTTANSLPSIPIPTLSPLGLLILAALFTAFSATAIIRRRRQLR